MKMKLLTAAAVTALVAQPLPAALAQDSNANQTQQNQAAEEQLQKQDSEFARKAAADNAAELELARLAEEKAGSEEVKEYAATLVEDHTKAGDELQRIAEEQSLSLEPELPQEAQQAKEKLSGESGAAFDRAFVEQMVSDHEKAVQLFEEQAASGQNEALKQFANSTVDTLRMHLDRARQLERQMGEQPVAGTPGGTPSATQQESAAGSAEQGRIGTQQAQDNPLMQMTGSELLGKTIVNQQGDEVGEIEDIVINRQDKVVQAVVSVGGFLGIGDKSVTIPFDELQPGQEGNVLLSSGATVEELKQRPAYDEASGDYERVPEDRTPADSGL